MVESPETKPDLIHTSFKPINRFKMRSTAIYSFGWLVAEREREGERDHEIATEWAIEFGFKFADISVQIIAESIQPNAKFLTKPLIFRNGSWSLANSITLYKTCTL